MSKITDDDIRGWLALFSISATAKNKKNILRFLKTGEHDDCAETPPEKCGEVDDDVCAPYTNSKNEKTCVTRKRIEPFEAGVEVIGKDEKHYTLLQKNFVKIGDTVGGVYVSYRIFYNIFQSIENPDKMYVIFPTGDTFKSNVLKYNKKLNRFLNELVELLIGYIAKNKKQQIILCGHSMGCVVAIFAGMRLRDRSHALFKKHIKVVGSGAFKCLDGGSKFSGLENVKIFMLFVKSDGGDGDDIMVDYFANAGYMPQNYKPLTMIAFETGSETAAVSFEMNNKKTYNYLTKAESEVLHQWVHYYKILILLYPYGGVSSKKNAKNKTKKIKYVNSNL